MLIDKETSEKWIYLVKFENTHAKTKSKKVAKELIRKGWKKTN